VVGKGCFSGSFFFFGGQRKEKGRKRGRGVPALGEKKATKKTREKGRENAKKAEGGFWLPRNANKKEGRISAKRVHANGVPRKRSKGKKRKSRLNAKRGCFRLRKKELMTKKGRPSVRKGGAP